MNSFSIELVSNASCNYWPKNSHISVTKFQPEQGDFKEEWALAFSVVSYPLLHQNVTEVKFILIDGRESSKGKRKIEPINKEPGLYPSFVDIVVAIN